VESFGNRRTGIFYEHFYASFVRFEPERVYRRIHTHTHIYIYIFQVRDGRVAPFSYTRAINLATFSPFSFRLGGGGGIHITSIQGYTLSDLQSRDLKTSVPRFLSDPKRFI